MSRLDRMRSAVGALVAAAAWLVLGATAQAYSGSIILFDHDNGTGASMRFEGSVRNLYEVNFNDRANSVYVLAGKWELCVDADFENDCGRYGPGMHNLGNFANSISSLRPINTGAESGDAGDSGGSKGGFLAFRGHNGEGDLHRVMGIDAADLTKVPGFNDSISSIAIFDGFWQICEHKNFKGQCITLGPGVYNLNNFNDRISSVRRIGD